jgi:hypothetical protein
MPPKLPEYSGENLLVAHTEAVKSIITESPSPEDGSRLLEKINATFNSCMRLRSFNPLKDKVGEMEVMKEEGEVFSDHEDRILATLSNALSVLHDRQSARAGGE